METYLILGWGGVVIFLLVRAKCLHEMLLRHVDRQFPEEAKVIRSHEWQMHPWSQGARVLRALIHKESGNDPVLAHLARKAERALVYFIVWLFATVIIALSVAIYSRLSVAN